MPEQSKVVISGYQNEKEVRKNYQKLAKKITDVVVHKIGGVSAKGKEPFYDKLGFEVIPNGIRKMIELR